jgi:quinol monooxygenase YgiN
MIILLVRYKCKPRRRNDFFEAIKKERVDELSMAEKGNIRYEYSFGVEENELILTEIWEDEAAIEVHKNSAHFARLGDLKTEFVENTEIAKFSANQI